MKHLTKARLPALDGLRGFAILLIYNALREYKPTRDEENLHMVWLESFEEMLVVNYGEPYPDAN